MSKNYRYIMIPLFLTGCVGTWISGKTGHLGDEYPDIRTVPEKEEAQELRGQHTGDEKLSRIHDFKTLENDREQAKARDEALREEAFPNSKPPENNKPSAP